MGFNKIIYLLTLIFFINISLAEVIYKKDNLIITNIDIELYKKLYENNYGSIIDDNNALKDLVLINNLLNHFEKNNKKFLDRIDSEISLQYGDKITMEMLASDGQSIFGSLEQTVEKCL